MQYLGGKFKIRKFVAKYLNEYRSGRDYMEPFVGAASILAELSGHRFASDYSKGLIVMWKALQEGWVPPDDISEEQYLNIKKDMNLDDPITAFALHGCAFAGDFAKGYARNSRGDNFCRSAKNSLLKILPKIKDVQFEWCDYRDLDPRNLLIYCDPPYKGTAVYGATGKFNSDEFWQIMRKWGENNTVIVSEYQAPSDIKCIAQTATKTEVRTKLNGREDRIEKLFIL